MRDAEVIAAADEAGIAMVFTGMRHFATKDPSRRGRTRLAVAPIQSADATLRPPERNTA